ncbi:MAG: DUF4189 domain-containing protein [Porphyrobacter sp.]|nr:DUF4189 domain-containing protein [Porphyrobacter sp.]
MRFPNARQMASMLLIGLGWCLLPAQAQAQAYVCGSGPGPGERQVGWTPGGNGVGSVPLCMRDGYAQPAYPTPPPPPREEYAAIAAHPDAADVWVTNSTIFANFDHVKGRVLEMCNAVMGGGCVGLGAWRNSSYVVFRNKTGSFYTAWLDDGGAARERTLAECSAEQLLPCEVFGTFSSVSYRSPDASARKLYAASAWVAAPHPVDYKLYIASGLSSPDAAIAAAVKACQEATSQPCELNQWTGNGFIQTYRLNGGDISATVETTAERAQDAAWENCRKLRSTKCELQASFDSRKPGLFVHDFVAASAAK